MSVLHYGSRNIPKQRWEKTQTANQDTLSYDGKAAFHHTFIFPLRTCHTDISQVRRAKMSLFSSALWANGNQWESGCDGKRSAEEEGIGGGWKGEIIGSLVCRRRQTGGERMRWRDADSKGTTFLFQFHKTKPQKDFF